MSHDPSIQNTVLEKIRAGEVRMRPKRFFILRRFALYVAAAVALAVSLLALSYALFSIRESGAHYLLQFGSPGIQTFLALVPWAALALFISLLLGVEFIMRRFTSAYRFSLLRLFSWIFLIGLSGSALLDVTPLHPSLFSAAHEGQLPVLNTLYEKIDAPRPDAGLYLGTITSIGSSTITIAEEDRAADARGKAEESVMESSFMMSAAPASERGWTVVPPAGTAPEQFSIGDKVYVGGREKDGVVQAYGIHEESKKGRNKDTENDGRRSKNKGRGKD